MEISNPIAPPVLEDWFYFPKMAKFVVSRYLKSLAPVI